MAGLSKSERVDLARDAARLAGDLNATAVSLASDIYVFGINDLKTLEARAKALFDKLLAEAAD